LAGGEFLEKVHYYGKAWLPARAIVEEGLKKRFEVHPSGEIVQLNSFCPWKDHLYALEKELGLIEATQQIKFVLFEDTSKSWRVQAVSTRSSSFENRLSLPAAWRGLRDDALSKEAGIPDCVFVHVRLASFKSRQKPNNNCSLHRQLDSLEVIETKPEPWQWLQKH